MRDVIFYSGDPGGAECLIPPIRAAREYLGQRIRVFARNHARDRFARAGIEYLDLGAEPVEAEPAFVKEACMAVTSATSIARIDPSETRIWSFCKSQKIPSLAFLDQWQNYVPRFSECGRIEDAICPDAINAINETGRQEMLAAGFTSDRLFAFGQPYLDSIPTLAAKIDCRQLKGRLGQVSGQRTYLFVSEALEEYYGKSRGYNQFDALSLFFDYIMTLPVRPSILLRAHPKEDASKLLELASIRPSLDVRLVGADISPVENLLLADAVFGMTSIMLLEALILNRPACSIQPNLQGEDAFVLTRRGFMCPVMTLDDFARRESITSALPPQFHLAFDKTAFLNHIQKSLS